MMWRIFPTMIKQTGTVRYVSISGGKIAAILLILICSIALAWATRGGNGHKSNTSIKRAQPLPAHTNQTPTGRRPVSPTTHSHSKAAGKGHVQHGRGALSNFKAHSMQSAQGQRSEGAGGANPKRDATTTPTPEKSPSPTPDTTSDLSLTATPASSP
jgi:hypothetical protein